MYTDLDTVGGSPAQDRTGYLVGVYTDDVPDGTCGPRDPNSGKAMLDT